MHVYIYRQACAYEVSLYSIRWRSILCAYTERQIDANKIVLFKSTSGAVLFQIDIRSMLDRFKPFTLDEDRSSLCRSICASAIFYNDSKYVQMKPYWHVLNMKTRSIYVLNETLQTRTLSVSLKETVNIYPDIIYINIQI